MSDEQKQWESPYERAAREGRESGQKGGDWRDNPYTPGTRQYYEFEDGQKEQQR